jgi:hypothetical protein
MPGRWIPLQNQPKFAASTMLLLTDGTVMCQESGGVRWYKLTPNINGDYVAGSWTALAPMINTRLYYASAVLRDGRVIVGGGEYSNAGTETNHCELYDPVTDTWTAVAPPAGWTNMGDAACTLLPDGRLLVGYYNGTKTALYDPASGAWSAGPSKGDSASEETWTLLPDATVLTVQCSNRPHAEKYLASANKWVPAGTLPVDLVEPASIEIGPACLLPDGRVFCIGATGHTALYTPPAVPNQPGSWARGPDFPTIGGKQIGAKDAPACLMPNGRVLLVGGPVDGQQLSYLSPTYFFEFDPATSAMSQISAPPNAGGPPYTGRMMLLPSGQVMFAAGSNAIYCYNPSGHPQHQWRPHIVHAPTQLIEGFSYSIFGRQFNGLSQAVAYGDDAASATNYPLVRLRNPGTGRVAFCRTFDHSTMAVATGPAINTTNFHVPFGFPAGPAELTVIANGISSEPVRVDVRVVRFPRFGDTAVWNWLIGSLADGPLWVWGPHGPVPVDPWGPLVAREAKAARQQMLAAMKTLEQLGRQVVTQRAAAAKAVPPAVDEEAEEAASDKTGALAAKANGRGRGRTIERSRDKARPAPGRHRRGGVATVGR